MTRCLIFRCRQGQSFLLTSVMLEMIASAKTIIVCYMEQSLVCLDTSLFLRINTISLPIVRQSCPTLERMKSDSLNGRRHLLNNVMFLLNIMAKVKLCYSRLAQIVFVSFYNKHKENSITFCTDRHTRPMFEF